MSSFHLVTMISFPMHLDHSDDFGNLLQLDGRDKKDYRFDT
jgi:hypothetical protein